MRTKQDQRDSRIELMRIIAAFLVLAHHAIQHGGNELNSLIQSPISLNQAYSTIIGSWGQLGVTLFVLISCWFMTDTGGGVYR